MARRVQHEQAFQRAVADYLGTVLAPPVEWTAIGHGGGGAVRGAILKSMGLKAGWPDIIVTAPYEELRVRTCINLGLELKAGRNRPDAGQKEMHERLTRAGWHISTCYTLEDVHLALVASGIPYRRHTVGRTGGVWIDRAGAIGHWS
jgi:hypothetical protein